ncbi:sugar ABC transporter permease [Phototrophicus methaneseepsis]|uniref:Sugar ABC transporter permease n=1 Tax=Phototrophicus methaneseepsis TaxID=2710758 RepID=A0A7S8ECV9_9CHLR|nr:sugar ABC transporter permease [Phototrophicus methaneseepsis]QPC84611.1 sugar ABC transporter permease [Phototrophicus methaneseepsis]
MGRGKRDRIVAILMLLPSIILLAIFVYYFIGSNVLTSLTDSNVVQRLSQQPANYVGMQNYESLFTGTLNGRFRIDIINTIFFTVLFIAACLSIGLLLAVLLDQKIKGEAIFRTIFLFPMALSFVVTGVIWKWLFNPSNGINVLPTFIGLPPIDFDWFISQERWFEFNWQDFPVIVSIVIAAIIFAVGVYFLYKQRTPTAYYIIGFALLMSVWILLGGAASLNGLARQETHGFNLALFALVVAATWQMSGYTMAMYLAGLRGIPEELREAARVDGAGELGVYRYVVMPMLAPITLSAIIILGHISLKIFDLVFVMGGGDNLFIDMPGINMYFTTFRGQEFGVGAAIATIMLVMVATVIIPYLVSSLRTEEVNS